MIGWKQCRDRSIGKMQKRKKRGLVWKCIEEMHHIEIIIKLQQKQSFLPVLLTNR
jgi:hypothetical protein